MIHSELFWYVNKTRRVEEMLLPRSTSSVALIWIRTPHCALLIWWPLYISLQSQLPFSSLPQMRFLFIFSKHCKATFRPTWGLCENKTQLLIHLKRSLFSLDDNAGSPRLKFCFNTMSHGTGWPNFYFLPPNHQFQRLRECVCGC